MNQYGRRPITAPKVDHVESLKKMEYRLKYEELTNEERLECIVKTMQSKERQVWSNWLKENNLCVLPDCLADYLKDVRKAAVVDLAKNTNMANITNKRRCITSVRYR